MSSITWWGSIYDCQDAAKCSYY